MRKLLQKDAEFVWTKQHEAEMEDLKEALTTKPILAHPDFTDNAKPFVLYVDSSKTAYIRASHPKSKATKMTQIISICIFQMHLFFLDFDPHDHLCLTRHHST